MIRHKTGANTAVIHALPAPGLEVAAQSAVYSQQLTVTFDMECQPLIPAVVVMFQPYSTVSIGPISVAPQTMEYAMNKAKITNKTLTTGLGSALHLATTGAEAGGAEATTEVGAEVTTGTGAEVTTEAGGKGGGKALA